MLIIMLGAHAQDSIHYLKVRHINIAGNKKTKDFVIHREMTIHENDSFPAKEMDALLLQQRLNIFNIGLFNDVSINIKNWEDDSLDLSIQVHERWVIIPLPIIKFVDRNVVEWWKNYRHDFKRLQYGAQVNWRNLTGRNDALQLGISFGFAQRLDIGYAVPQFNIRKEKVGMSMYFTMLRTKRIAYATTNDVLSFMNLGTSWQQQKIEVATQVTYRNAIHNTHYFTIGYGLTVISDSVRNANPNYFLNNDRKQHYFKVGYTIIADHRNLRSYPTAGWYLQASLTNYGLGFMRTRMTTTSFQLSKYFQWKKHQRFSGAAMIKWQFSWPFKQPYNLQNTKSLGYDENTIRGYELNVIDGQHYLLFKNEYRFRVFSFQMSKIKKFKGKNAAILNSSLAYLPLNLYLTAYFDAGYVWDNYFTANNQYKNKWQFGYGIGLNFVTFNQKLFRIEYSINRYLKKGVYLHFEQPL
ncbi:MAG TPA: POTRA domain-containing protein [Chitinophagales bacterium]|nr:POTRA domain-containing protein [Chitinophagales bacterium]HNF50761.1 POTRA domain-containing protein [Chitinophagales bacterium]